MSLFIIMILIYYTIRLHHHIKLYLRPSYNYLIKRNLKIYL